MAVFCLQVGLLGYAAGKWIHVPALRWATLIWSIALFDLQVVATHDLSLFNNEWPQRHVISVLSYSFIVSQCSFLAIWAVLGPGKWQRRLPWISLLAIATAGFAGMLHQFQFQFGQNPFFFGNVFWLQMLAVHVCGACSLLSALRICNIRIEQTRDVEETADVRAHKATLQFNILDLLIWTTIAAAALTVVPLAELFGSTRIRSAAWVHLVMLSGTAFMLSAVSLWTGLGKGKWYVRWPILCIIGIATGLGVRGYFHYQNSKPKLGYLFFTSWVDWHTHLMDELGWWWVAWSLLGGFFLAGLLLTLRGAGYRLVKASRKP